MEKVTAAWLREMGCCDVEVFEAEWPEGCLPTEKNLLRAVELGMHLNWFAHRWLTGEQYNAYWVAIIPLNDAYWIAREPIDAAFQEALAPLHAAERKARAPVLAQFIKERSD